MKKTVFVLFFLLIMGFSGTAWADEPAKPDHWAAQSVAALQAKGFGEVPADLNSVVTDPQWEKMVIEVFAPILKEKSSDYAELIFMYTHLNRDQNTQREWAVGGLIKLLMMAGKASSSYSAGQEDYLRGFSDASEITDSNFVLWQEAGRISLITGYPDGTLRPQKDMTFAEGAALLAKAQAILNK